MGNFVKVAKVDDVPPGEVIGVDVGENRLAIVNIDGTFHAFSAICGHMGGPLDEGFLEGASLQCPWHAGEYDVETGQALTPPASGSLEVYAVRVAGDDLEIEQG